jgi:hypothetical protein
MTHSIDTTVSAVEKLQNEIKSLRTQLSNKFQCTVEMIAAAWQACGKYFRPQDTFHGDRPHPAFREAIEAALSQLKKEIINFDASPRTVTIPIEDYLTLVDHAEASDMIVKCETCGAWLVTDETACATTEDYTGCWKMATDDHRFANDCKSYRATVAEFPKEKVS